MSVTITCALFYGDETLLRRNGIEGKIAATGVAIKKRYAATSARNTDVSSVDIIVYVEDTMPAFAVAYIREAAKTWSKPVFALDHRRSHETWRIFERYLDGVRPGRSSSVHHVAIPTSRTSSVAESVAETEELATMYQRENEDLKARVIHLEAENESLKKRPPAPASDVVARETLTADLARANAERTKAVREKEQAIAEMTAKLEAAERERAQDCAEAKRTVAREALAEIERLQSEVRRLTKREAEARDIIDRALASDAEQRATIERLTHEAQTANDSRPDDFVTKARALIAVWRVGALTAEEVLTKIGGSL